MIKDQREYALAVKRSYLSRKHFDAGQYSEPLMLRNMFLQWTLNFNEFKFKQASGRRGYVLENHRASFTKFSQVDKDFWGCGRTRAAPVRGFGGLFRILDLQRAFPP